MPNIIHFKGLDTLRFIAAFAVMLSHISFYRTKYPNEIFTFREFNFFHLSGSEGVILFFTLSGFLITYLLMAERKKNKHIDIKKFYIRRALRIWPLYYWVLFICTVLMPFFMHDYEGRELLFNDDAKIKLILCLFILPNTIRIIGGSFPGFSQAWSIGVEEQFYLIWPHIVNNFRKNFNFILIGIFFFYVFSSQGLKYLNFYMEEKNALIKALYMFFISFKFDCMIIGSLGASLVFSRSSFLRYIYHPITQMISFTVVFFSWFILGLKPPLSDIFYSLLFIIVIINIATNPKTLVSFEWKITNFFGKISYGLYMYHMPVIIILGYVGTHHFSHVMYHEYWGLIYIYLGCLVGTSLISYLSFEYLEKPFIRLKSRFQIIKSK